MKQIITLICIMIPVILVLDAGAVYGKPRATVKSQSIRIENPREGGEESLVLPYAFSSDSMGTVIGVGGGVKGFYQRQLLIAGSVFGSTDEDTFGFVLGAWDYRPSWSHRLFFSVSGSYGEYPKQRAYSSLNFEPDAIRPGSNESEKDDFLQAGGKNNWLDFKVEYVLPIGAARTDGMVTYHLNGGMVEKGATGGETWNPLQGGITTIMLRQYNQLESFETTFGEFERPIHPIEIGIGYNNTDFPPNPSIGSNQYLGFKHDFGWGEANTKWTFLEFETSKYFSFGKSSRAKQRVLALNFWTGEALSWDEKLNSEGNIELEGNPPQYDGATLGGMYRMRAFPSRRFHDRSVIYTTAEFRYTPKANPIGTISWLRWLKMDWYQFVGFIEGGRVANEYSDLFSDWQTDIGFGLRAYVAGGVVRLDIAASDEESSMWVMFGHPF